MDNRKNNLHYKTDASSACFGPTQAFLKKCRFPVSQSHSVFIVQMVASVNLVVPQPWLCWGILLNSRMPCVVYDLLLTAQQSSSLNKQKGLINLR